MPIVTDIPAGNPTAIVNGETYEYEIMDNNINTRDYVKFVNDENKLKVISDEFIFEPNPIVSTSMVKLSGNKILLVYKNSSMTYLSAQILTISDKIIFSGTSHYSENAYTTTLYSIITTKLSNDKILVLHEKKYSIITIGDDDSITFSTSTAFTTSATNYINTIQLSNNRILVCYNDTANNNYGTCKIFTVNNDISITIEESEFVFTSYSILYLSAVLVSNNKVFLSYYSSNYQNTSGEAMILDINDSNIISTSPESLITFDESTAVSIKCTLISDNTILITYLEGNTYYCRAAILTIDDTDDTMIVRYNMIIDETDTSTIIPIKLSDNRVFVVYDDTVNNETVSRIISFYNDVITINPKISIINTDFTSHISCILISNNRIMLSYNKEYGSSKIIQAGIPKIALSKDSYSADGVALENGVMGETISIKLNDDNIEIYDDVGEYTIASGQTLAVNDGVTIDSLTRQVTKNLSGNIPYGYFVKNAGVSGDVITVYKKRETPPHENRVTCQMSRNYTVSSTSMDINAGDFIKFTEFGGMINTHTILSNIRHIYPLQTLTNDKVLVCYQDKNNSNYSTVAILTVNDDNSVTLSEETLLENGSAYEMTSVPIMSNKILLCYRLYNGSINVGTARLLTINDDSIVVGNATTFSTGSTTNIILTSISNTKALVTYDSAYSSVTKVLTVDTDSIILGTEVIIDTWDLCSISTSTLISDNKILISYTDNTNDVGAVRILDINGDIVTVNAEYTFTVDQATGKSAAFISNNKVLLYYQDRSNFGYGTAQILTIDGNTITEGQKHIFKSSIIMNINPILISDNTVLLCYTDATYTDDEMYDDNSTWYGLAQILNINDTTITSSDISIFDKDQTIAITKAISLYGDKIILGKTDYTNHKIIVFSKPKFVSKITSSFDNITGVANESGTSGDIISITTTLN